MGGLTGGRFVVKWGYWELKKEFWESIFVMAGEVDKIGGMVRGGKRG